MTTPDDRLNALRREIDEVDDRLHDLLIRRTEIVEEVGRIKRAARGSVSFIRPGREALILRRLNARHRGRFPRPVLMRLWREMIIGSLCLEGPFSVAVFDDSPHGEYWDLARDHFGSYAPIKPFHSPKDVVREVLEGNATVGVLPAPNGPEPQGDAPWWIGIANQRDATPRIVARLPFAAMPNSRAQKLRGFVIASMNHEQTGDDRSLVVVEIEGETISRDRLFDAFAKSGLPANWIDSHVNGAPEDGRLYLFEVEDHVVAGDPRVAEIAERLSDVSLRLIPIGGYAVPLSDAELAPTDASEPEAAEGGHSD